QHVVALGVREQGDVDGCLRLLHDLRLEELEERVEALAAPEVFVAYRARRLRRRGGWRRSGGGVEHGRLERAVARPGEADEETGPAAGGRQRAAELRRLRERIGEYVAEAVHVHAEVQLARRRGQREVGGQPLAEDGLRHLRVVRLWVARLVRAGRGPEAERAGRRGNDPVRAIGGERRGAVGDHVAVGELDAGRRADARGLRA